MFVFFLPLNIFQISTKTCAVKAFKRMSSHENNIQTEYRNIQYFILKNRNLIFALFKNIYSMFVCEDVCVCEDVRVCVCVTNLK